MLFSDAVMPVMPSIRWRACGGARVRRFLAFAAPRARRWASRLAGKRITAWKGAPMSTEDNKAITRRLNEEVWNKGRLEVIDDLIAADFVTTVIGAPEQIRGPQ